MFSATDENVVFWHNKRQLQSSVTRKFERSLYINTPFVQRLWMEKELEGHSGCVNCLEWNSSGSLLASGSDDFNVIIWNMLRYKCKKLIKTQHVGNIFSVKFLAHSDDHYVASAGADASIRIHSIANAEQTRCFNCHIKRIKRICVTKQSPYMLWSGSEDGTIREYDLREPHTCSSRTPCRNVLINLKNRIGNTHEVKCIQLHPLYPEWIAVGCTDQFVRLYDRRMIGAYDNKDNTSDSKILSKGCFRYFTPGHLKDFPIKGTPLSKKLYVTTYINFSPNGDEIIQNLGGEHIYIYNLKNDCEKKIKTASKAHTNKHISFKNGVNNRNGYSKPSSSTYLQRKYLYDKGEKSDIILNNDLPKLANDFKLNGNDAFSKKEYFQAILWYNKALQISPNSSILFANKGAALLKRAWDGDVYDALRLFRQTLLIDPTHVKAMYRQVRCLYELKWYRKAKEVLETFKEKCPDQLKSSSFKALENDIKKVLDGELMSETVDSVPKSTNGSSQRHHNVLAPEGEMEFQKSACDYAERYVGACNTNTDIKEANFFGSNGQFIIAGSDCGCMLLWDRKTTNLIEAWKADESIVNCVQPHPSNCTVATSGIDHVVRLWSPRLHNTLEVDPRGKQIENLVYANQKRMNVDPLEEMLRSMGYRDAVIFNDETDGNDDDNQIEHCRTQ